jgi:hypothetical protein
MELPKRLQFATGNKGLLRLAELLDRQNKWEQSFKWNFEFVTSADEFATDEARRAAEQGCGTAGCALGLIAAAWPQFAEIAHDIGFFPAARQVFQMSDSASSRIFDTDLAWRLKKAVKEVTPGDVAEEIRSYVSQQTVKKED